MQSTRLIHSIYELKAPNRQCPFPRTMNRRCVPKGDDRHQRKETFNALEPARRCLPRPVERLVGRSRWRLRDFAPYG